MCTVLVEPAVRQRVAIGLDAEPPSTTGAPEIIFITGFHAMSVSSILDVPSTRLPHLVVFPDTDRGERDDVVLTHCQPGSFTAGERASDTREHRVAIQALTEPHARPPCPATHTLPAGTAAHR